MNGVLVIDKPADYTSFDVVAVARGLCGQKKIGHTGTLDPMATGVLPLLLGRATRAASLLPDTGKAYRAGFSLGFATDTQDGTGRVTAKSERRARQQEVTALLPRFTGTVFQLPPMYSAVSVNGQRLYKLARQGLEVEREERPVTISRLELEEFDEAAQSGVLFVECSGGTYIRTLVHDLGQALGTFGAMTSLRRTRAAGFSLEDALPLEQARTVPRELLAQRVLPVDRLFQAFSRASATGAQARRFCNGGGLALNRLTLPAENDGELLRLYDPDELFLGLGRISREKGELTVEKLFCEPLAV